MPELRLTTRASVYYLSGRKCFAVQDRRSGGWKAHHRAIGAVLQVSPGDLLDTAVTLVGCRAAFLRNQELITTTTVRHVSHGWI